MAVGLRARIKQAQSSTYFDDGARSGMQTMIRKTLVTALVGALAVSGTASCSRGKGASQESSSGEAVAAMTPSAQAITPPPGPSSVLDDLASADLLLRAFAGFVSPVEANVGIVAVPVGRHGPVVSLGQWKEGPAWSTSKVPLVLAALDEDPDHRVTASMEIAIMQSDNTAADTVWQSLGTPEEAAAKMDKVLRNFGDPTNVESRRLRGPNYSAFGQTIWSLANQAKFLAAVACSEKAAPVFNLMQQIEPGQRWGLGSISDTRFKGGWGPSVDESRYLLRQFGLISTAKGMFAVAIGADVNSRTYDSAIPVADALSGWISEHVLDFPAGTCPSEVWG